MIPLLVYNNTLIDSIEAHPLALSPLTSIYLSTPALFSQQIHRWQKERFFLSVSPFKWISSKKKKQNCSPGESPAKSFPTFRCDAEEKNSNFVLFFIGECCAAPIYWKDPSFIGWRIGSSSKTLRSFLTIEFLTPFILVEFFVCCFVKPTKKWEKNPVSIFFDFLSESKKNYQLHPPPRERWEKSIVRYIFSSDVTSWQIVQVSTSFGVKLIGDTSFFWRRKAQTRISREKSPENHGKEGDDDDGKKGGRRMY